mmetsp:Transcript_61519/g.127091  ORF Transcript_61519/g.127091 Transcript_61519/m.127091 type:complete len:238 (-) Transcript_61519:377-1090(-)
MLGGGRRGCLGNRLRVSGLHFGHSVLREASRGARGFTDGACGGAGEVQGVRLCPWDVEVLPALLRAGSTIYEGCEAVGVPGVRTFTCAGPWVVLSVSEDPGHFVGNHGSVPLRAGQRESLHRYDQSVGTFPPIGRVGGGLVTGTSTSGEAQGRNDGGHGAEGIGTVGGKVFGIQRDGESTLGRRGVEGYGGGGHFVLGNTSRGGIVGEQGLVHGVEEMPSHLCAGFSRNLVHTSSKE